MTLLEALRKASTTNTPVTIAGESFSPTDVHLALAEIDDMRADLRDDEATE